MVQESKRHWQRLEQNAQRQKVSLLFSCFTLKLAKLSENVVSFDF